MLPLWFWWLLAALNVLALVLAFIDKVRAQRGGHRIRERTLLAVAIVGGSGGLLVGMVLAHHKVRKPSFLARLLLIVVVQAGLVAWLYVV